MRRATLTLTIVTVWLAAACSSETDAPTQPNASTTPPAFERTVIGTAKDGLAAPTDLAFTGDQLWVVNQATNGAVIYTSPGTPAQSSEARVDRFAEHFMMKPSALAFGEGDRFATCQESRDEWNEGPLPKPDDFMGPTLWSSDLTVFAKIGQVYPRDARIPDQKEGSHLDMLHESPLCMGIAHESGQAYWVFDGMNANLVRYDFKKDHGPGGSDHSDGVVRRHTDVTLTRTPGVPSHMAFEPGTARLYIADTGTGRVLRVDTAGGASAGKLTSSKDLLAEYTRVTGTPVEVVAEGLKEPSGVEVQDDRVFVSDHATGTIVVYGADMKERGRIETGRPGITGLAIGPDGKLWYVDRDASELVRVDSALPL